MSRPARQTAAFSLFTFLDVMLCTLGALIIVLICVVRTAQIKNAEDAPQVVAEIEEIDSQRDTVEWRAKHLATSRDAMRAQLQDRRLELSHIEEHSRRLQQQLAELEAAGKTLAAGRDHQEQLEQLKSEVARVGELAAAAERELAEARRTAESKRPSYAVVPYEGPSQTLRRPLYIECTADRIILQPENIELTPVDFAGPLGPGNPLAAGLRAAREYLNDYGDNLADAGEPYPLLLVRPDGVEAYYQAREAMSSWGAEFGYELIDQDWKLEFREPRPAMVEAMKLAVDEARLRQVALARAAPRYFSDRKPTQWYRAAPSGGVMREGGSGGDDDHPRRNWSGHRGGSGSYAGGGNGYGNGSGAGSGSGYNRPRGSGRYPTGGGGRGGSDSSSTANSDAELASIYGAAANAPPGAGLGAGTGRGGTIAATNGAGSAPGAMYPAGTNPGGTHSGSSGTGNSMLASGQGTGANPTASRYGTGTGSYIDAGTGGGDSFLAANSASQGNSASGLPGTAAGKSGGDTLLGTSGAPANAGPSLTGFNGNTYGAGTATPLGSSTGQQGMAGEPSSATGSTTATGTSAMAGDTAGNGATSGDRSGTNASAGSTDGQSAPHGQTGGDPGATGEGTSSQYAQGRAGQQGRGAMGMQPSGQSSGAASGPAGGSASGQTANPGGQAGMVSAASSAGGQPGAMSGGMPSVQFGNQATATSSMADRRGKDWSLPEEARHAVPISRPVRVECRADRLVLRGDQVPTQTQEIPLNQLTEDSVEDLVSAVWQRVDTWGTAGRGMYWRPQLAVEVAPGAEGRYADLQTLLADSGLEVKRAEKAPTQIARPKRKTGMW